jgi:hypothetical protein
VKALRPVGMGLVALLLATACGSVLKSDERAWCGEHPRYVVAASYTLGGPMTLTEVLAEWEADTPSPEYVRACHRAYQDR